MQRSTQIFRSLTNPQLLIVLLALVVTVAIWTYALLPTAPRLTLTVLDVGEGLCAVLKTPTGKIIVVDCGTSSWRNNEAVGPKLAAPYLQSLGVNVIDLAVLTHPHSDHISGYSALLKLLPAKTVLDIGPSPNCPGYREFVNTVRKCRARHYIAQRGQAFKSPDGVSIHVLNPNRSITYDDLNNKSIVLRVSYKRATFLLAGDIEESAESEILGSGIKLRSDVLLVGHHGAKETCSPPWLTAIKPRIAIISCGRGNNYGHPSPSVIRRLRSLNVHVFRTDKNGAILVSTDGKRLLVRTFRTTH
ncbi:MAG: ComEC/Rec2 family competence protein [Armatimonadota bacterium]